MKKSMQRMMLLLMLASAWLIAPVATAAPIDDFLGRAPEALRQLVGNSLSDVDTRLPQGPWSASGSLFGMPRTTIYLYWVPGSNTPVVAVALPDTLTADRLLHVGAALDVGVTNPVLLWVPEGVTALAKAGMPGTTRERAITIGLADTVPVIPGFNLFGRVARGSFLDALLTPVNLAPANLTAGLAKGKEGAYVISLLVPSTWSQPFGLADTSITGATVRVIKDATSKTVEAWGAARIKNKNFTVYLKRDETGLNQSLGFDTRTASLEDFFTLAGVTAKTLGLPAIPWPSQLPLNKVTIDNPKYDPRHDPRNPPDFTRMMFQAARANGQVGELNVNIAARVFGWEMGAGHIKADSSGVDGAAALAPNARIGPIEVPSAAFYLKVNPSVQAMGIKAQTPLYGQLDLQASGQALKLAVPTACPLRPVGFTADVSNITSDFPIKPVFADCFSRELQELANGTAGAYQDAEQFVGELARDTASTAEELGRAAARTVESLHLERAAAWPGTIKAYTADIRSAKDAAKAAADAVAAAQNTVNALANKIIHLDDTITSLANDIRNLLKKLWGAVTGEVKRKQKEKEQRVSERDAARTEKAAADVRLADAQENLAEKSQSVYSMPGPYLAGKAAELYEPLVAAQAQALTQPEIAGLMRALPAQLKDASKRKEILGTVAPETVANALEASFASNPPKLSDLVKDGRDRGKDWLGDAKKNLVSQALAKHVEGLTETVLQEKVASLATVALKNPVRIILVNKAAGTPMCMEALGDPSDVSRPWYTVKPCSETKNQTFRFERTGGLRVRNWGSSGWAVECIDAADGKDSAFSKRGKYCSIIYTSGVSQYRFFYDAVDGLIRYQPPYDDSILCVRVGDQNRIVGGACPSLNQEVPGTSWRLVKWGEPIRSTTMVNSSAAGHVVAPGRIPLDQKTNLQPLQLKPW